ncbi:hypothetical protein F5Y02DRAFT_365637 [Annulohypoxylon stygium]|nr:hypothetical protein F5Y02DRAFT_365637 [Annulohypoxylon stygium]
MAGESPMQLLLESCLFYLFLISDRSHCILLSTTAAPLLTLGESMRLIRGLVVCRLHNSMTIFDSLEIAFDRLKIATRELL